jgi:hypothetical protein
MRAAIAHSLPASGLGATCKLLSHVADNWELEYRVPIGFDGSENQRT